MTDGNAEEFTVSDLIRGWDDLRRLLNLADPEIARDVVSSWPEQRLATALVAAVMVVRPDDAVADDEWPSNGHGAATSRRSGVGVDRGQSGHMTAPVWPR